MVVSNKPKEDISVIARKIRHGEELPDYIKEQVKGYKAEPKKQEEPKKEKTEEEKDLDRRETELFPKAEAEKAEENGEEEDEDEDIYEKMLKRMKIPN